MLYVVQHAQLQPTNRIVVRGADALAAGDERQLKPVGATRTMPWSNRSFDLCSVEAKRAARRRRQKSGDSGAVLAYRWALLLLEPLRRELEGAGVFGHDTDYVLGSAFGHLGLNFEGDFDGGTGL
jgi:hypothetical protein